MTRAGRKRKIVAMPKHLLALTAAVFAALGSGAVASSAPDRRRLRAPVLAVADTGAGGGGRGGEGGGGGEEGGGA